ncbi:hypothetical protein REPUB_Repub04eG0237300 [Reevesia pubescens]
MAKTKEREEAAKSDYLEIISIGSLKQSSLEQQGKDRYPYPVGYQAVRAQNGSTYKVEIHEGPKEPLFMGYGSFYQDFLPLSIQLRNSYQSVCLVGSLFPEHKDCSFLPLEGEDIVVWLLVSTFSVSDAQHEHLSSNCQANPSRCWRLALLVKDRVILGSTLDPRAAAIGASFGHGIMGRDDGLVYVWELSKGTRLGILHHFKGGSVSCIATDDLRPDVLAVAADDGQLLV